MNDFDRPINSSFHLQTLDDKEMGLANFVIGLVVNVLAWIKTIPLVFFYCTCLAGLEDGYSKLLPHNHMLVFLFKRDKI